MEKQFLKKQWLKLVIAAGEVVLSVVNLITGDDLMAIAWIILAMFLFFAAVMEHDRERIELLEAKSRKYDAICEEVQAISEELHTLFAAVQANHAGIDLIQCKLEELQRKTKN